MRAAGGERHEERDDDQREHGQLALHTAEPAPLLLQHRLSHRRKEVFHGQGHQRHDGAEEREAVEREAPRVPEGGERQSGERRSEDARQLNRIELSAMAFGMSSFRDERRNERRVGRSAEGLREARDAGEGQNVPDVDRPPVATRMVRLKAQAICTYLRAEEHVPAVEAVGEDAADEGEEEDRKASPKIVEGQQELGIGERVK